MTLRAEISIAPFGSEEDRYELYRLDISNTGLIRNEGFGHEICSYRISVFKHNNETEQRLLEAPEWELVTEGAIPEHDRRDGAVALVAKATKLVEGSV